MELLLPMAAQKLDLSFNIDRDVPPCMSYSTFLHGWFLIFDLGVYADYARIRQG